MNEVASEIGVSPELLASNLIVMPNFMSDLVICTKYSVWSEILLLHESTNLLYMCWSVPCLLFIFLYAFEHPFLTAG